MDRREFLIASAGAAATFGLGKPATAQPSPPAATARQRYMLWTGLDGNATGVALRTKYKGFKDRGLTGVFVGGGIDDREFDIIRECGLELHTWMWTTNRGEQWIRDNHPDWFMVSRSGKSCFDQPPYVGYYRWISPVIPGVQSYLTEKVEELAAHPAVSGVHLDYVRYPDVILPRALWETYKLDQTEELPDYDFCYSKHTREAFKAVSGRDPLEIKDPAHDQEWLHFRQDTVTKLVEKLAAAIHGKGKEVSAAVFPTPSIARKICRQDWGRWPLDFATPMIYHSFYIEPVAWIGDCLRENLQAARFPIVAGLYMPAFKDAKDFAEGLEVSRHRGAGGVSIFGGLSEAQWNAYTDSIAVD